jgi:hypothetical protein
LAKNGGLYAQSALFDEFGGCDCAPKPYFPPLSLTGELAGYTSRVMMLLESLKEVNHEIFQKVFFSENRGKC